MDVDDRVIRISTWSNVRRPAMDAAVHCQLLMTIICIFYCLCVFTAAAVSETKSAISTVPSLQGTIIAVYIVIRNRIITAVLLSNFNISEL